MIAPRVITKRTDRGWKGIREIVRKLGADKPYVKAGVLGKNRRGRKKGEPSNVEIAIWNEFGTKRLGGHGAGSGSPPRPFVGASFRRWRAQYVIDFARYLGGADKFPTHEQVIRALTLIGMRMAADMKNYVTMGSPVPPPNAPSTIARKGSSRTLVDSGGMVNSITSAVVSSGARK